MAADEQAYALTQQVLQSPSDPLVDKPKLTAKLLAKPPFRFLHDVVSAVQAKTGFAPGLFAGPELDAHAIQDKEMKITYLTKIMTVVSLVLQQPVPAKPAKQVVAGLEPEKTNTFLQMLGTAARLTDAADIVQAVLRGAEPFQPGQQPPSASQQMHKQQSSRSEEAPARADAAQQQQPPPQQQQQQQQQLAADQAAERQLALEDGDTAPMPTQGDARAAAVSVPAVPAKQRQAQPQPLPVELELPRPASGGGSRRATLSAKKAPPRINSPTSSAVSRLPQSAGEAGRSGATRPPSAGRLGPAADQPVSAAAPDAAGSTRPSSAVQGALGRRGTAGTLGADDDEDDDDGRDAGATTGWLQPAPLPAPGAGAACGVLVKDILSTAQQLEEAGAEAAVPRMAGAGQAASSTGIILSRQAKPAAAAPSRDQSALSGVAVQQLCQVVLPLGRTLEFLHADVDSSMSKEFRFWSGEARVYRERLGAEQRAAHDVSGLEGELAAREAAIRSAQDTITVLRSQVLHGSARIARLLSLSLGEG